VTEYLGISMNTWHWMALRLSVNQRRRAGRRTVENLESVACFESLATVRGGRRPEGRVDRAGAALRASGAWAGKRRWRRRRRRRYGDAGGRNDRTSWLA